MFHKNQANRMRTEILARLAQSFWNGDLEKSIDRIPLVMRPKDQAHLRCCLYKDRATIRYRILAALGKDIQAEEDELKPLAQALTESREETVATKDATGSEHPVLSVLDTACQGCVPARYLVTNACQGCVARPCSTNCGKGAVTFEAGKARIQPEKCVNCGKCQEVCPYRAITRVPVPCEESCPVGAIQKNESGKAKIDVNKCVSCGRCMSACPFDAVMERLQFMKVLDALKGDRKVIALVAPAIVGQYPGTLPQILAAVGQLGFSKVVEVAIGADETAEKEADEFVERMHRGDPLMTTSCCPAYVRTVERHVPELKKYVSDTPSPMIFAARAVKGANPEALTVFIGPCVAKRVEAMESGVVDFVLNFEELGALFVARNIEVARLADQAPEKEPSPQGRAFAVSGGACDAVRRKVGERAPVRAELIEGLNKRSLRKLQMAASGSAAGPNFLEVMCCESGCVGGPCVISSPKVAAMKVSKVTGFTMASAGASGAGGTGGR